MKKIISMLLVSCMVMALFTGCTAKGGSAQNGGNEKLSVVTTIFPEYDWVREITAGNDEVDITMLLDSTMVLSEVSNMMVEPDSYMGKTVRMKGVFVNQIWNGQMYYACIIADATACCSQGLEFVPAGNLTFPDDFPELGSEITVVGEFSTYREDEFLYFTLLDAVIENVE